MMAELPRLRAEDRQEILEHLWPIEEATPTRNRFLPWEDRACRAYPCAARVSGLPESAGLGRRAPKRLAILSRLAFYPHSGTPSGHHHPIEHRSLRVVVGDLTNPRLTQEDPRSGPLDVRPVPEIVAPLEKNHLVRFSDDVK